VGKQPSRRGRWLGYAAAVWAFSFAAVSFYWAAGGTGGLETLGAALRDLALARDPVTVAVGGWGAGIGKLLVGSIPLALIRRWRTPIAYERLRLLAGALGVGMGLYGGASFLQHLLMLTGALALPAGLGRVGAQWHLALWDPWWLCGGLLFTAAAWATKPHIAATRTDARRGEP
jgi:hypothetical protein